MAHILTFSTTVSIIRKLLMVVGILLFVAMGGATLTEAGTEEVAKDTQNIQPELKATTLFVKE